MIKSTSTFLKYFLLIFLIAFIQSCVENRQKNHQDLEGLPTYDKNQCEGLPPCANVCEIPGKFCKDKNGLYYQCNSLILEFPKSIKIELVEGKWCVVKEKDSYFIEDVLDNHLKNLLIENGIVIPATIYDDNVQRCMCDRNLFLYQVEGLDINGETGMAGGDPPAQTDGDGGSILLNWMLEAEGNASSLAIFQNCNSNIGEIIENSKPNGEGKKVIAILDSGYNPDIVDYNNFLITDPLDDGCIEGDNLGWNFVDYNNYPFDDYGHGTIVSASYIFGLGNNETDELKQKILPVKVLDKCGRGTVYEAACGMYYAIKKKADLINTSFGLYQNNETLEKAVSEVVNSKIILVTSAGNKGLDLNPLAKEHFPSGYAHNFQSAIPNISLNNYSHFVAEVGGICAAPSQSNLINHDIWTESNTHDLMFIEPAIKYEVLFNSITNTSELSCQIKGTSFSAPMFSADVMKKLLKEITPVNILDSLRLGSYQYTGDIPTDRYYLCELQ